MLKEKSDKEIREYIRKKSEEREAIKTQIQELNKKRKDFIAEKQNQASNGLESAMLKAIKTQAQKKNYRWK